METLPKPASNQVLTTKTSLSEAIVDEFVGAPGSPVHAAARRRIVSAAGAKR